MNYDRLNDHLDKKIIDFNLKAMGFLSSLLFKPLATATDPFFRKNLGERYFTGFSAFFGAVLWFLAGRLGSVADPVLETVAMQVNSRPLFAFIEWANRHHLSSWIGWIVLIAFAFLAWSNLNASSKRQISGEPWHSMSRGESIWGREDRARDLWIVGIVGLLLLLLCAPVGLLFLVSRVLSYHLIAQEQASIYARFLDARDAQIENDHLMRALDVGAPPRLTEGLYGPLHKKFKGDHRKNIARVAASGGIARVAGREQHPDAPNSSQFPASKTAGPASNTLFTDSFVEGAAAALAAPKPAPARSKRGRKDAPLPGRPEISPEILRDLRRVYSEAFLEEIMEAKATNPDFPPDAELLRGITSCYTPENMVAAHQNRRLFQAVAEYNKRS